MEFLGAADDERDYVFIPDAMRTAIALSTKDAAFGEPWIVAGSGPLSPRALAPLRIPAMADTGSGDGGHPRSVATQPG